MNIDMVDERTPLLQFPGQSPAQDADALGNHHLQFCKLVGVKPMNLPEGASFPKPDSQSLYLRAQRQHSAQRWTYLFTATLSNSLLLTQVVLGAALTALGASDSSRVLITVFGALNTVIAGLIAYLKSRGQPMRARMYRDDLERVVDEIENSAVMWLGISHRVHGYDAIDTDEQVTVRSEVARLTRLYDRAIRANTINDPDMYAAGGPSDAATAALRSRPIASRPVPAPVVPAPEPVTEAPPPAPEAPAAVVPAVPDPDESPATKVAPKQPAKSDPVPESKPKEEVKEDDKKTDVPTPPGPSTAPPIPNTNVVDPDESPASAPPKPHEHAQVTPVGNAAPPVPKESGEKGAVEKAGIESKKSGVVTNGMMSIKSGGKSCSVK